MKRSAAEHIYRHTCFPIYSRFSFPDFTTPFTSSSKLKLRGTAATTPTSAEIRKI